MKPFKSDGCSGGMSALWRCVTNHNPPWEGACETHDRHYYMGGSPKDRLAADRQLAANVCMSGYPIMAAVMYYSVRVGGHPWLPLPWRWGFGYRWPKCKQ